MTDRENNARGKKRTVVTNFMASDANGRGYSVLSPPSGEMPKAEGDAQAVYFAMNISREPGDIHRSVKVKIVVCHLLLQRHSDQRGGIFVVFLIGQ